MSDIPVVILAGGRGTRLEEATKGLLPKPLIDIGGRPMIEHIIGVYQGQGFSTFVIAGGYRIDALAAWLDTAPNHLGAEIMDTGLDTQTGGRVQQVMDRRTRSRFMLTYGDGISDINLNALLDFHSRQVERLGVTVTLTAVRPPSRFGALQIGGDGLATVFLEKPQAEEGWVNGGFYVVEPDVRSLLSGDRTMWEYDVLPALAAQGRLAAYKHAGFWQCVDMPREQAMLDDLYREGRAPWARWMKA